MRDRSTGEPPFGLLAAVRVDLQETSLASCLGSWSQSSQPPGPASKFEQARTDSPCMTDWQPTSQTGGASFRLVSRCLCSPSSPPESPSAETRPGRIVHRPRGAGNHRRTRPRQGTGRHRDHLPPHTVPRHRPRQFPPLARHHRHGLRSRYRVHHLTPWSGNSPTPKEARPRSTSK